MLKMSKVPPRDTRISLNIAKYRFINTVSICSEDAS